MDRFEEKAIRAKATESDRALRAIADLFGLFTNNESVSLRHVLPVAIKDAVGDGRIRVGPKRAKIKVKIRKH